MFVREKTSPDLIAIGLLVIIAALGLVPTRDVLAVFSNPAPITVAAMFVLSAALVRCGALDDLSVGLEHDRDQHDEQGEERNEGLRGKAQRLIDELKLEEPLDDFAGVRMEGPLKDRLDSHLD